MSDLTSGQKLLREAIEQEVRNGKPSVSIVTDQSDYEALARLGLPSVVLIEPGMWHPEMVRQLEFCRVGVFPHAEDPSFSMANRIREDLQRAGGECYVWRLGGFADRGPADWIERNGINAADFYDRTWYTVRGAARSVSAAEIEERPVSWLIDGMFVMGRGGLLQGNGGVGKTALLCRLAAHVTTGEPLLGRRVAHPGGVMIFSGEDDPEVLRARLSASGADLSKVFFPREETAGSLTLVSETTWALIHDRGPVLVIFDPIQQYLGARVDMHRANETRPVFTKLWENARREGCAVILTSHVAKGGGNRSLSTLALGSTDINAAMRSIFHVMKHPSDPKKRLMIHAKSSSGPLTESIVFEIVQNGGVEWKGTSALTAEDAEDLLAVGRGAGKAVRPGADPSLDPLCRAAVSLSKARRPGAFIPYDDVLRELRRMGESAPETGKQIRYAFETRALAERLNGEGIRVVTGVRGPNNTRGIRLERIMQEPIPLPVEDEDGADESLPACEDGARDAEFSRDEAETAQSLTDADGAPDAEWAIPDEWR